MKIKAIFWMAPLTLSLLALSGGACFAQSGVSVATEGGSAEVSRTPQEELVAAAVLPRSAGQADAQADDSAVVSADDGSSEAAEPTTKESGLTAFSRVGIGVKVSTLGVGIEAATPLAGKFNVRGGFNMFRYSQVITNDGIDYNGQLQFQSAEAHLDWFPFGGFHVSPGLLFYNGNQVTATAAVPGGQTFSVGGTSYESDTVVPVTGTGKLSFLKVSPSIMVGIGNLIPRNGRHYSFLFEVGAAYQGSARVALNLTGTSATRPERLAGRFPAIQPSKPIFKPNRLKFRTMSTRIDFFRSSRPGSDLISNPEGERPGALIALAGPKMPLRPPRPLRGLDRLSRR